MRVWREIAFQSNKPAIALDNVIYALRLYVQIHTLHNVTYPESSSVPRKELQFS